MGASVIFFGLFVNVVDEVFTDYLRLNFLCFRGLGGWNGVRLVIAGVIDFGTSGVRVVA